MPVDRISAAQTGEIYTFRQLSAAVWRVQGIGKAPDYFSVDSSSGAVSIRRPLTEDNSLFYSLQVTRCDTFVVVM